MFSVMFEVKPHAVKFDDYLNNAKLLRSELEKIESFIDNIRYKSLTRDGWILFLSNWKNEKAVVRWRTTAKSSAEAKFSKTIICGWASLRPTPDFPPVANCANNGWI